MGSQQAQDPAVIALTVFLLIVYVISQVLWDYQLLQRLWKWLQT